MVDATNPRDVHAEKEAIVSYGTIDVALAAARGWLEFDLKMRRG